MRTLEPKVMEVLVRLAKVEDVTSRDDLLERVWPDQVVTDHVLSRCISELRKAFGDDPRSPRVLETIRKRGYRLLLSPEPVSGTPVRRRGLVPVAAGLGLVLLVVCFLSPWAREARPSRVRPVPLTAYVGSELDPVFSPDGERMAFAWDAGGSESFDIYVRAIEGGAPTRLTDHPGEDKNPAWAPDGSRLAFIRDHLDGSGIHVVDLEGGQETRLLATDSGDIPDLVWSPDGRLLYFVDRVAAGPFALHSLELESGACREITRPPRHSFGDRDFSLSPGGDRIAFARAERPGVEDLFVVSLDSGTPRRLTRDRSSITGVEWVGEDLVFSSNRDREIALWRVSSTGGTPRLMGAFGDHAADPDLATGSGRLVFESKTYDVNIWRTERRDDGSWTEPEPFLTSTRWDMSPCFSPDGQLVAFVSDRDGRPEIWVADREGRDARRLTTMGGPFPDGLEWSPDGRWIVFTSDRSGSWQLHRVPATGGDPVQLTTDGGMDGAFPVRTSFVDTVGGFVYPTGGGRATLSPDGRTLLFSRIDGGESDILLVESFQ